MAVCRYCRNKSGIQVLVLVNPVVDILVELFDPLVSRTWSS